MEKQIFIQKGQGGNKLMLTTTQQSTLTRIKRGEAVTKRDIAEQLCELGLAEKKRGGYLPTHAGIEYK